MWKNYKLVSSKEQLDYHLVHRKITQGHKNYYPVHSFAMEKIHSHQEFQGVRANLLTNSANVCLLVSVCMCACMREYMCACVNASMLVCMHACMRVCLHAYVCA